MASRREAKNLTGINGIYTIDAVKNADGSTHEREARRKGHRVTIKHLKRSEHMLVVYIDEGGKVLRTSRVRHVGESDGLIQVTTQNSVYTFRKLEEGEAIE